MKPNLKVLVSAYACEPNKGSEPGVGWNWAQQISKFAEVWVITRANNREVIEKAIELVPNSNMHFIYIDLPFWIRFWKKELRGIYIYYYLWQIYSYLFILKIYKKMHFDICHHITFGNCWMPALLSLLPIPFIWGPIGGAQKIPHFIIPYLRFHNYLYEFIRNNLRNIFRLDPLYILTIQRSRSILVCNNDTKKYFSRDKRTNIILYPQMGITINKIKIKSVFKSLKTLEIISVGRLTQWKGFDLTIYAFTQLHRTYVNSKLRIVGSGIDFNYFKNTVKKLNLDQCITFTNQVPQSTVLEYIENSDILLFPSLHDGNPKVVLEAMSSAKPIICLDLAGPGEMVTDECGIKVKPVTYEQTINDLANALLKLANNPELRMKMGDAGRKRVEQYYTWNKKGDFIKQVYEDVLGRKID